MVGWVVYSFYYIVVINEFNVISMSGYVILKIEVLGIIFDLFEFIW